MAPDQSITFFINYNSNGGIENVSISKKTSQCFVEKIPGELSIKCKECCSDIFVEFCSSYNENKIYFKEEYEEVIDQVQNIKSEITFSDDEATYQETKEVKKEIKPPKIKAKTLKVQNEKKKLDSDRWLGGDVRAKKSDLKCIQCEKILKTRKILDDHICSTKDVKCTNCRLNFTTECFEIHKNGCTSPKNLECFICKKIYSGRLALTSHLRGCRADKMGTPTCKVCSKTFTTWYALDKHKNVVHLNIKDTYVCQICGKRMTQRYRMKEHIASHNLLDPYKCDICGYQTKVKETLRSHIILNHKVDYNFLYCTQCDPPKKFIKKHLLVEHQNHHAPSKRFPCSDCSRTFKSKLNLKSHHFRFHTPLEVKKKFICDFPSCNFVTTVKGQYKTHKFVHLDPSERPFKCKFCNKGYTSKTSAETHELTHINERPFSCSVCGRGFKAKDGLKVHMRLHTGEKPYECEICQQRFSDRGCYRSHIMSHEKQLNVTLSKSVKKFIKDYTFPEAFE